MSFNSYRVQKNFPSHRTRQTKKKDFFLALYGLNKFGSFNQYNRYFFSSKSSILCVCVCVYIYTIHQNTIHPHKIQWSALFPLTSLQVPGSNSLLLSVMLPPSLLSNLRWIPFSFHRTLLQIHCPKICVCVCVYLNSNVLIYVVCMLCQIIKRQGLL